MKRIDFNHEWTDWIRTNLERGCSKDELARILIGHGFDLGAVQQALNRKATPPATHAPSASTIGNLRRFDCSRIELYLAERFLDAGECQDIVSLAQGHLRESTISAPGEPDRFFRRSMTCDLGLVDHPSVKKLDDKICAALGTPPSHAEPTQAQHYEPGGEFKPHTDYFEQHELARFLTPTLGQRTWTFMVYLNEAMEGGQTAFLNVGLVVRPKTGLAVIWNNLRPDGRPNPDTLHHGMPVKSGHKDIITKWFRMPRS